MSGNERRGNREAGFTLLELIVVTGIIGVLAAIAIPQYASYKSRAVDTQMQSALKNARTAMEAYFIKNQLYTTDITVLESEEFGYSPTETVDVDGLEATATDYRLRACAEGGSFAAFEFNTTGANSGQTVGVNSVSCTP